MATTAAILLLWAIRIINPGSLLLSVVLGVSALFAADLILGFTHSNLPVNSFTVLCAVLGGVPGVVLILLLNALLTASI